MRRFGESVALLAATLSILVAATAPVGAIEPTVPVPRGFVNDYTGTLDPAVVRELDGMIAELKQKTGAEIAVVVVKTVQPLSTFDYALKIAETWKPGQKEKDNGVVFLAALDDRDLFILTGYGVEGPLPDGRVGEIRDRLIVPAFRQGDYSGGVRAGTWELARAIAEDAGVTLTGAPPPRPQRPQPSQGSFFILLAIVLLFILLSSRTSGGWMGPGYRGRRRWSHWNGYPGGLGGGFGGFGGGGGGGGGGGFGGFGGGGFGGGGAGGRW